MYRTGAELGCPYAKSNLAERYHLGAGVALDKQKALQLYKEAAEGGDKVAREKVTGIEKELRSAE